MHNANYTHIYIFVNNVYTIDLFYKKKKTIFILLSLSIFDYLILTNIIYNIASTNCTNLFVAKMFIAISTNYRCDFLYV